MEGLDEGSQTEAMRQWRGRLENDDNGGGNMGITRTFQAFPSDGE